MDVPRPFGRTFARLLLASVALSSAAPAFATPEAVEGIQLPAGFRIDYFARDLADARSLALGPDGLVFVGSRGAGRVYALRDRDGNGEAEERHVVLDGLRTPNGVAVLDGDLYVAENHRVIRLRGIAERLADPPRPEVVVDGLPRDRAHGWRYLAAGPDGALYFSIGAPCNVCDEPGYAEIRRLDPRDGTVNTYATGIRNSVGLTWHPETGELWFTDNGRDWLGDDRPPDELNRAPQAGLHFGFPFCHGDGLPDPEFGAGSDCADFTPPAARLGAHVAALGLRFYTGRRFPARYRNQLFIAEHGSWNRSSRVGYRIALVTLAGNRVTGYRPFAQGWLRSGRVYGRPVDLLVMPDGALLVSDDEAGAVYRITYTGE